MVLSLFIGAIIFPDFASAELPQEIFFQAKLTRNDNKTVGSGRYKFNFRLYTGISGGSSIWSETQSLIPDSLGVISCYLGSVTSFPTDLDFNSTYYLSIEVNKDGEMSPRIKIVPSMAALNSKRLAGLSSTQFLRSDAAATMSGTLTLSNYIAQVYTGSEADAIAINYNPSSGSNSAIDLTYGSGGGTGAALKITQNGTGDILQVYDSSSPAFFIKGDGNVGIGTLSPTEKLEVDGTIKATAFSGDGSGLTGITGLISDLTEGRITKAGSDSTLADSLIIESGGNIGIGTSSPAKLLDVSGGAIRTDNQFISTLADGTAPLVVSSSTLVTNLNADTLDGYDSSDFISSGAISAGTAGYLAKYTSDSIIGASDLIYDNGTNVGIGTTSPSAKLEIVADGIDTGLAFNLKDSDGEDKVTILDNGNVGLGSANPTHKLEVAGNIKLTGCIRQGGLGDLAEMIPYSSSVVEFTKDNRKAKPRQGILRKKKVSLTDEQKYNSYLFGRPEPGDVVVIAKDGGIRRSFEAYATNVAGVISTEPAQLLRDDLENAAPVALSGIVPCKVSNENGAIEPGDILVCSSVPGHAMNAGDNPPVGSLIGKALGKLDKKQKVGVVNVLVTLK